MSGDQQDQYKNYYNQTGQPGGGYGSNIVMFYFLDPFGGFGGFGQQQQDDTNFKDFWEGIDDFFGGGGQKDKSKKGKDIIVNLNYLKNLFFFIII